jgi:hypothetical protein
MALVHSVAGPRHYRGRRGGRHHRRPVPTSAPPQPLGTPSPRVLERPRPLQLAGRHTGRWSPQTPTPHHGVVRSGRVPSTVGGVAPTGLHRRTGYRHHAVKGRRRRRRRRRSPHHGSHRPCGGVGDTPDGANLHRSTGPTPRTAGATDRHDAANLVDTLH